MINWHLEKKKVSELKNWEKNPRTISEKAFKELESSVETLGNFEPLVANIDGTVIAGNQRLRVEMNKGTKEVDVYVPERELTEDEIKKIGIISNRHSGEWDFDILSSDFEEILIELDIKDLLGGFGFDNVLPSFENRTIGERDMDNAQNKLDANSLQDKQLREQICPYCGKHFFSE